jgi:hypothetical protein
MLITQISCRKEPAGQLAVMRNRTAPTSPHSLDIDVALK